MTRVIVVRSRPVSRARPLTFVIVSILMGIISAVNFYFGFSDSCIDEYFCDYRRRAYIISGSCFACSSVLFMIAAISLHIRIKQITRMTESNPVEQPVTISSEYPGTVVTIPTTPAQYPPPPYTLQTEPVPYMVSPLANQYTPQDGFEVQTQPTEPCSQEITKPPPYSP